MSTFLTSLLVLASVSTTEIDATKGLLAISDQPKNQSDSLVLERCEDFLFAQDLNSQILVSNPVHGVDKTRAAPFDWTHGLREPMSSKKSNSVDAHPTTLGNYMKAFGPIVLPSHVPILPLYLSDKATCLAAFGENK